MKARLLAIPRLLGPLMLLAGFALTPCARARVITGNIVNQADFTIYTITDGTNSDQFQWSPNIVGATIYVYATANTAVTVAASVTSVAQITNAAAYSYDSVNGTTVGPVYDAAANGGIGQFVVLKSSNGHYAAVRVDVAQNNNTLDATWWFQTDGTANFSSFVDTNALAAALDATNLPWSTGGDTNWFVETNVTEDGVSAAQSGKIGLNKSTWIQTTIPTNGTLSFYWKASSAQSDDFLSFYQNGSDQDDISGNQDWFQETYSVSTGDVLRWIYVKDGAAPQGQDAGWVDQVIFTPDAPITPVTATFDLVLVHEDDAIDNAHGYYAIPELTYISPAPVTMDVVQSSDGGIYGQVYAGNTNWNNSGSPTYTTLAQLLYAITNAQWTLFINQGNGGQQQFTFNVSIPSLTTNTLGSATMLVPALNATNVVTNTPFQWSGPAGYTSIFINTYQRPSFVSYGQLTQAGNATNWPSPPALNFGTNDVTLVYTSNGYPNVTTTIPVNDSSAPIYSWSSTADLEILTEDPFVVGAIGPAPVQLTGSPQSAGSGSFQLSFPTIPGRNEIVQVRTNLLTGLWTTVTNFTGDGSSHQFLFPTTNAPGQYFRVITQ